MRSQRGAAVLVAVGLLVGCGDAASRGVSADGPSQQEHTIVTTVGMVADIVRQVVGEHGAVSNIIGEGVDPHVYKPTRNDVAQLLGADVVFYSGLLLEGRLSDALIKVAGSGPRVFAVTELVEERYLLQPESFKGHFDPHLWMDVQGWMQAVDAVAESMSSFDAAHAADYHRNAEAYKSKLEALDDYARRCLGSVPESSRVLITAHDAFNYFGRAYGFDVLGIQGISTESEAGLEDINALVDLIVDRHIAAVFVETSVADKNVRALIEGAASRGHEVVIGGSLFSDAMGQPGSYEGTYIGMIDHNVTTITIALGGDAPPGGMNGKLRVTGRRDE